MKKNPKNYHHGDLRNSLLTAARDILEREGAAKLSLREAAKKAAVSSAAPYRHFKSKEDLLVALAEKGFADMEKTMQDAARRHPNDPRAQLMELGKAYLELAAESPHFFRMMFSVNLDDAAEEGILRACDRVYHSLIDLFRQGQQKGQLKTGSPEEQGMLFWSTLHGYSMLYIDGKLGEIGSKIGPYVEMLEGQLKLMFKGLEK